VDGGSLQFWEIAQTMNWGIHCSVMARQFIARTDPSVERAVIGRRRSETELVLLNLLEQGEEYA